MFVEFRRTGVPFRFGGSLFGLPAGPPPQPFEFMSCAVRYLARDPNDSPSGTLCVFLERPVFLSNGNGPTVPMISYKLNEDGTVSYGKACDAAPGPWIKWENWSRNVPVWRIDSIALATDASNFWLTNYKTYCPRMCEDIARLIAQKVLDSRYDRAWTCQLCREDNQQQPELETLKKMKH